MTDLEIFYQLKKSVLEHYQNSYPYFKGSWKNFSSQDILNLIDDIQLKTKQSVSEKWIYTHLKPDSNKKLPRKDMLDILSVYIGKSAWDELKFNFQNDVKFNDLEVADKNSKNKFRIGLVVVVILVVGFSIWKFASNNNQKIEFQNSFTKDSIAKDEVKAFVVEDSVEKQIDLEFPILNLEKGSKVVLKSPLYKPKEIIISTDEPVSRVELSPNDYAMMLNAFMKSDIKDWQTRKEQLNKILSDNLEVMVMLQNDLGAEYLENSIIKTIQIITIKY